MKRVKALAAVLTAVFISAVVGFFALPENIQAQISAYGPFGAVSLTSHGVVLGHGTSVVTATTAGTAGQALISGGASADPSFSNGPLLLGNGAVGAPTYSFSAATSTGMYWASPNLFLSVGGSQVFQCNNGGYCIAYNGQFYIGSALDVLLQRDATGVFAMYGGSNNTMLRLYKSDNSGNISLRPGTPTIGACGTSPSVSGSDSAMTVTVGTGGVATTCAVTFNTALSAWTTAPVCIAQSDNTADTALAISATSTVVTVTKAAALTASSHLNIICIGMKP